MGRCHSVDQRLHAVSARLKALHFGGSSDCPALRQDKVLSGDPVAKGMSSANDSEQDDHDSDHQKYVNETTEGVGSDQSKKPQDEQNNGNRIQHGY